VFFTFGFVPQPRYCCALRRPQRDDPKSYYFEFVFRGGRAGTAALHRRKLPDQPDEPIGGVLFPGGLGEQYCLKYVASAVKMRGRSSPWGVE
jgi:hypothetical protein